MTQSDKTTSGLASDRTVQRRLPLRYSFLLILFLLLVATPLVIVLNAAPQDSVPAAFAPVVMQRIPTPTPAPVPTVLKTIQLPDAFCPHYVSANPYNGLVYTSNVGSDNVSIIDEDTLLTTVPGVGDWVGHISHKPNSPLTFVSVAHGDIVVFDETTIVNYLPPFFEPLMTVYNPVNNMLYVVDIHTQTVRVYDGTTFAVLADIDMQSGALREAVVDTLTGYVYFSNWEHARVYVMQDTTIIDIIPVNRTPYHMAFDPIGGYIYVTHEDPQGANNITVLKNRAIYATYQTASQSNAVAVDPTTGLAYVANNQYDEGFLDTVSILQNGQLLTNVNVGRMPWSVAVDPVTHYVYVANRESNDVAVLRDLSLVTTIPAYDEPFDIAVNPVNNLVYVIHRNSHLEQDPFGRFSEVCDDGPPLMIIK